MIQYDPIYLLKHLNERLDIYPSQVEFLGWLKSLEWSPRPRFIVIECVAALAKLRKVVRERGTTVVKEQLSELGFCGIFKATCHWLNLVVMFNICILYALNSLHPAGYKQQEFRGSTVTIPFLGCLCEIGCWLGLLGFNFAGLFFQWQAFCACNTQLRHCGDSIAHVPAGEDLAHDPWVWKASGIFGADFEQGLECRHRGPAQH